MSIFFRSQSAPCPFSVLSETAISLLHFLRRSRQRGGGWAQFHFQETFSDVPESFPHARRSLKNVRQSFPYIRQSLKNVRQSFPHARQSLKNVRQSFPHILQSSKTLKNPFMTLFEPCWQCSKWQSTIINRQNKTKFLCQNSIIYP